MGEQLRVESGVVGPGQRVRADTDVPAIAVIGCSTGLPGRDLPCARLVAGLMVNGSLIGHATEGAHDPAPGASGGHSEAVRPVRTLLAVLTATIVVAITGCRAEPAATDDDSTDGPVVTYPAVPFGRLDAELTARLANDGLDGAVLVVTQDGAPLHRAELGSLTTDSVVPVGEVGRWVTTVVTLRLVDDGLLVLDEPVRRWLPWLDGPAGAATLRHLLSHTSGLPASLTCARPSAPGEATGADGPPDPEGTSPSPGCDAAVAGATLVGPPGEVFQVSPAGFHVVARVIEAVTERPFAQVAAERVLQPAGMAATRFLRGDPEPFEGSDLETSAADLTRFLDVVLAGGVAPGGRIVSAPALAEAERDQTTRLDTHTEPWVAWTGVPTFGLGVWRDRLRGDGTAAVVSAPGRLGAYPWIDRPRNAHGVLLVVDGTDPAHSVGASAALVAMVGPAIDTEGRPLRRPGTPVPAQD